MLGQGSQVGVIAQEGGPAEALADQACAAGRCTQPGRLGASSTTPVIGLSGPGAPMPMAVTSATGASPIALGDRLVDPADHRLRAFLGLGQPGNAAKDLAIDAAQRGANLGPAEVNSND